MNASTKNARQSKSFKLSKTDMKKFRADERRADRERLKDYEKLIADFAAFTAEHPRLEWEIVSNYCDRNNRMLVQREMEVQKPERSFTARATSRQHRPSRPL